MVATYIEQIMHNINCATQVYVPGRWFACFWCMFLVCQVSLLVNNFYISIFLKHYKCNKCHTFHGDTKRELYLFITLLVTLTLFHILTLTSPPHEPEGAAYGVNHSWNLSRPPTKNVLNACTDLSWPHSVMPANVCSVFSIDE